MNTNQAKMFVSSLSSSAAKVLIAFIMARSALDVHELRDWTGMKRDTIYDALRILQDRGMIDKQVLAHRRAVWLPAADVFPGFLQLSEKRATETVQLAPKRATELQLPEKRTTALVGGGESINLINTDSSINTNEQMPEKRTTGFPSVKEILAQTPLLFDGSVVIGKGLDDREPLDVLAWCAYAYSQKKNIRGAGGVVRNRLVDNETPPEWAKNEWADVLPGTFLEALKLIEYSCDHCDQCFGQRAELEDHVAASHHICMECGQAFGSQELEKAHYEADHNPYKAQPEISVSIAAPALDGTISTAWVYVLTQLQQDMPRASFDTWVRDTAPVRYDSNVVEIGARNAYARDWLKSRLTEKAQAILAQVLGQNDITVKFVVVSDTQLIEVGEEIK